MGRTAKYKSEPIRIRLMAGRDRCAAVAEQIAALMRANGYELLEKSEPYPCRPPKADDDRIYLTFIERAGETGDGE